MLGRLYTRVRGLDEFKADALLAGALAISGAVEAIFVKSGGHSRLVTAVVAVTIAVPIAWRRRNTLVAIMGFWVLNAASLPLNTFLWSSLTSPFIAILILAYTIGRHETGRRMWFELVFWGALIMVVGGISRPADVLWSAVFFLGPALAGRALRSRSLLQREMREKTGRLEAERDLRARRAVEDERSRIASELQAVVANGVSAMVVQAEAVPRLLGNGERPAAAQALAMIEETGRDALAEMRRLLGVLRRDDEGPVLAPQPTLARADALVARVNAQGLETAIDVKGTPVSLAPGVDLAGYRVLQEALSAASRADGVSRAEVSIVYGDDNVVVTVGDDREASDGPDAEVVRALRERVALYGGILRTAHRQGGRGVEFQARLPIGRPR